MSLIVFNGSPRGKNSNSNVIASWFSKHESICYLNQTKSFDTYLDQVKAYDKILFVFPLYVDGMPGQVKLFFEKMYERKESFENKDVVFIIHSGFSEGIHCQHLKAYLTRYSHMMKMKLAGVVVIPGSEGFRLMPEKMTEKKAQVVKALGTDFLEGHDFDQDQLIRLQGPLRSSFLKNTVMTFLNLFGIMNIYWNSQLKKNNAFKKRYNKPY